MVDETPHSWGLHAVTKKRLGHFFLYEYLFNSEALPLYFGTSTFHLPPGSREQCSQPPAHTESLYLLWILLVSGSYDPFIPMRSFRYARCFRTVSISRFSSP